MTRYVADASVAIKWLVREEGSDSAWLLVDQGHEFHAPEFMHLEVANALWRKAMRGEIDPAHVRDLLVTLQELSVSIESSRSVVGAALHIALQTGRTVYDSLYLALALELDATLLTADARYVNALRSTQFTSRIETLGD